MTGPDPIERKGIRDKKNTRSDLSKAIFPENGKPDANNISERSDQPNEYETTLATWTKVVGVFTGLLFLATGISAYFLWKTDSTLHETLVVNQRPWLSVDVVLGGPLSFDSDKGQSHLPLEITVKNTGLSPAQNVSIIPVMYPNEILPITTNEILKSKCSAPRGGQFFGTIKFALFPGQIIQKTLAPGLTSDEVFAIKQTADKETHPSFTPSIVVCVSYLASIDKTLHFTTVFGALFAKESASEIGGIELNNATIPADRLMLVPMGSFSD